MGDGIGKQNRMAAWNKQKQRTCNTFKKQS